MLLMLARQELAQAGPRNGRQSPRTAAPNLVSRQFDRLLPCARSRVILKHRVDPAIFYFSGPSIMPRQHARLWLPATIALACFILPFAAAAQEKPTPKPPADAAKEMPDQAELFKKFGENMSGAKLVGNFTIDGMPTDKMVKEEYHIVSASKMPNGDYWLITARIKYGKNDITLPMPLEVKWAGKTPVITLDEVTIPGLGTFSSRVVIDGKRYAGTWQHGDKGGLLFGAIERSEAEKPETSPSNPKETKPATPGAESASGSPATPPARKLDPLPPPPSKATETVPR
jgi:hypothetical protein